jgi:hypothetical protein
MTEFWPSGLTQAGTDPVLFLKMLEDFGLSLNELDSSGRPRPIRDKVELIGRYQGRRYTNVAGFGPAHKK